MTKKAFNKIGIVFAVLIIVILAGVFVLKETLPPVQETAEGIFIPPVKTEQMQRLFQAYGYDMYNHQQKKMPVPPIFVQSVPSDFNRPGFDEVRPALFVEMMLPVILKANKAVEAEREALLLLKQEYDETGTLSEQSSKQLSVFAKKYDVREDEDLDTLFSTLIPHVDSVPPTLLLTMAAEDSGWATSRYAREYNAVFNQRDWDGNGIVPDEQQKDGPQYRIKTFPSLYDAVMSQILYLNTNGYFENFRIARAKYRRTKNDMRGYSVAHLFINFPYKPFKYPDILKHLIQQYELVPLDFVVLGDVPAVSTK